MDNIIELKLDPTEWLKPRISEGVTGHPIEGSLSHEQNMTESSLFASEACMGHHDANAIEHVVLAQMMKSPTR